MMMVVITKGRKVNKHKSKDDHEEKERNIKTRGIL